MHIKCEEELKLLEKMLMEPESNQIVNKEEKCSIRENLEHECNSQFNIKYDELILQASNNKLQ